MTFQKIIILCAGLFLVNARKIKMMSKMKREPGRRYPSDAAATAEAARRTANQVIMNVLNQAGSSNTQPENMEVNPGNASVACVNFHSEVAADGAHPLLPPSGRYDSIKIQRSIRGEQAASDTGPKVDRFTCGSFYNDGPAPILRADLQEDSTELLISTTSFSRMDWVCLGCESGHKLLPKKRNKSQWTKGRKLVILSDQNMPASLPSKNDLCPAIIRVENGLLCELGDLFFSLLKDFTLPEGSVLLIGSLTHIMEEGLVGYAKKMGAEFRRFSKLFDYTVHVVPFLPPPLGGTNDPDLVSNSYHIMTWLEHVQKWNLTGYYNMLRHFLTTSAAEGEYQLQKTQRYLMPASYELFGDYVLMCHPIPGFGGSLPRMCVENEKVLVNGLLKELNIIFKWNLDTDPPSLRELGKTSEHLLQAPVNHTDAVVIGGSNGKRLHRGLVRPRHEGQRPDLRWLDTIPGCRGLTSPDPGGTAGLPARLSPNYSLSAGQQLLQSDQRERRPHRHHQVRGGRPLPRAGRPGRHPFHPPQELAPGA
jgi:hypothetical protein